MYSCLTYLEGEFEQLNATRVSEGFSFVSASQISAKLLTILITIYWSPNLLVLVFMVSYKVDCAFLSGCHQAVELGKIISQWLPVHAGVPQGIKLRLILFLFMVNDLALQSSIRSSHWNYVDDLTISEVVTAGLQEVKVLSRFAQVNLNLWRDHYRYKSKWLLTTETKVNCPTNLQGSAQASTI